jgi:ferredoxin-thioredoxin reductase catalytic chain
MSQEFAVTLEEVERLYQRFNREAEAGGYHLNPEESFTKDLLHGLLVNEKRYGYWACPCRLASGDKAEDLDIICPCDYRDPDLNDYGACYCALYVTGEVLKGERKLTAVPERRPLAEEREKSPSAPQPSNLSSLPYPVWRCKVCGYLCAREGPPEVCPVCKAKKDRFERFL